MEQQAPINQSAASDRTPSIDGCPGASLQTTQVAAWTVENNLGIFRYVLRSDNKLCYRWKFSKLSSRWFKSMPYYVENDDCRTPEEAEELFEYLGWLYARQPARDGRPFKGVMDWYAHHIRQAAAHAPIERPGTPRMLTYPSTTRRTT